MATAKQFHRSCDVIRDALTSLSREANNAAFHAGCLKLVQGRDAEETFEDLCNNFHNLAVYYERAASHFERFVLPPDGVTNIPQTKQEQEQEPEQEVLNLTQAARFLGVTKQTLRIYIQMNAIPYRRVMRRYFFYRAALAEWASGNKQKQSEPGRSAE